MLLRLVLRAVLLLGVCVLSFSAFSQEISHPEKTLSPYFFVPNGDPSLDALPLKHTEASVSIAGPIALVTVKQTYKNEGKRPIEAIYTFPASTRAAVNSMKMTIGDRTLVAKIEERKKARQEYEAAKKEGKSTALLESQRPNVFQMNVANVLPGDVIQVEMQYSELLYPENGTYEFVYPTVVGPRYSKSKESDSVEQDKFVKNPYLRQGEKPTYTFHMEARIMGGMPIEAVACESHKVKVEYTGKEIANVSLTNDAGNTGNRDFVLRYKLAGKKIQAGLLLYPSEKENFFALIVEPPSRPALSEISPREYIFVVDVSGSMFGFPLETSKKLLRDLISKLRQTDHFNVLLFASGTKLMAENSVPATVQNIEKALAFLGGQHGAGGTELLGALNQAFAIPRVMGASRTIVLATDGYVSVEKEAFDLVKKSLGQANFFVFGIGSSVNRHLLEGLSRAGRGEPYVVLSPTEAAARATRFRESIEKPVLTGIQVRAEGVEIFDVEPAFYPDVFSERPLVIFGKYKGEGGKITVTGLAGKEKFSKTLSFAPSLESSHSASLKYLWARSRIAELSDMGRVSPANEARTAEITNLGLTYSLLTDYTSFVAIDTVVRNQNGKTDTVLQPLPLPENVSDFAVGGGPMQMMGMPSMRMPIMPDGDMSLEVSNSQAARVLEPDVVVVALDAVPADVQKRAEAAVAAAWKTLSVKERKAVKGLKLRMHLRFDASGAVWAVRFEKQSLPKFGKAILQEFKGWELRPLPRKKKLSFEIRCS
jgi:Ca-activated chloride channel family protein